MGRFSLNIPQRRTNYRFALTPLADAMFQLLIFFMLSAGLTPYSLLTFQSAPALASAPPSVAGEDGVIPQVPALGPDGEVALWTIEADTVLVGGQRFGFDALDDLAEALGATGAPASVVLIVRPSAQVQDITTVLARLTAAEVASVQVSIGETF
ncbi:Biopolymer transport protein ExbD/TolR [Sulfitobacter noctilucae]|uniref:ExbD/TolR family protein n=1 Tax=Sulfitobacter noctilucae TaxID=1342302 RepID=UPI000561AD42|nr:biopolymer transporter ExbD [Sulfitobacter noctilucae]KIN75137.1 Biopolymer transport protein ExbD/TolR [Sulfitobacter noctilucae]